ncbi:MAG TPA: hypothetical protein ENJ08_10010 [Gammaproteobacteria bacterium]|nr:hypothetical protein [Gammaproteobacteria bacterium]
MKKQYRHGTHRSCSPAQTLSRIKPFMSAMGITRVANITGLDHIGIPVVTACRPNSRALSVAQGKGLDLDSAKASAVMEAMESYHAEYIELTLKHASYNELRAKHQLIDVTRLQQLSISYYHHDLALLWVEGVCLMENELEESVLSVQAQMDGGGQCAQASRWVPYDAVHTNYTLPLPSSSGSFMMSTNGLASGNCPEEAISHGICELVERDSTSLWQLNGGAEASSERMLDLSTVTAPDCLHIINKYQQADISVGVWDTTTDTGICSFYCTIIDRVAQPMRPLYPASGAGCHPCKEVALLRALTEAAQTRLTLMSGSRDDTGLDDYEGAQDQVLQSKVRQWLNPENHSRHFSEVVDFSSKSFTEDIRWMLRQLKSRGLEDVVVVNLSKPEFDLSVVRVLIPGLEGIADVPGYRPGERARAILNPEIETSKKEQHEKAEIA